MLRNLLRESASSMEPQFENLNIALAGSGILAPGIMGKTTPTVLSKKGCSNRPHAKRATRPAGLSTCSISVNAVSISAKNMIPKRQVILSTLELEKGS